MQGANSLAFLIRKLGGHSFHELNIPLRELKAYTEHGPDLSYDFFTRAQCVHALLTQDANDHSQERYRRGVSRRDPPVPTSCRPRTAIRCACFFSAKS